MEELLMISTSYEAKAKKDQENDCLHIAARYGQEQFMQSVLCRCPDLIYQQNMRGDNPLHVAARAGHLSVVELLIGFVQSLPSSQSESSVNIETEEKSELPSKPIWRTKNKEGNTALHEALRNKQEIVALYLLDLDSGLVELANAKDETPLYLAAKAGFVHVLNKIIEVAGSKPNTNTAHPNGQTPFHAAVFAKSQESIRVLNGSIRGLIRKQDLYGKTALYYATQEDSLEIMHLLLELDPSLACICDNKGLTPLLVAIRKGRPASVQAILDACPTPEMRGLINKSDQDGNTPLHLATMGQNYQHVQILLSTNRVDSKATNNTYQKALSLWPSEESRSNRQTQILNALKQYGGRGEAARKEKEKKDIQDKDGVTITMNTMSVVAALLATITFAAVLQVPGGYKTDGPNVGSPLLIHMGALKVFVFSDTVAFCCSMVALFCLIAFPTDDKTSLSESIGVCRIVLLAALVSAMIAFISGLYVVISIGILWFAILVCLICVILVIFFCPFLVCIMYV